MPSVITKICVICGKDVAHEPRIKDPDGRYYCHACYDSHAASRASPANDRRSSEPPAPLHDGPARGEKVGPPAQSTMAPVGELFTCPICNKNVTIAKMDDSGVCRDCVMPQAVATQAPWPTGYRTAKPKSGRMKEKLSPADIFQKWPVRVMFAVGAICVVSFAVIHLSGSNQADSGHRTNTPIASPSTPDARQQASEHPQATIAALDPDEQKIRDWLLFYARMTRELENDKAGIEKQRKKVDECDANGEIAQGILFRDNLLVLLRAQTSDTTLQNQSRKNLRDFGEQRVYPVRDRLLEDAKTPSEYRLILFEFRL